jgi:alpha-L-fucosidase
MNSVTSVGQWFSKRKFGLFLHFGLYSVEGWHEQDQMRRRIPRADYANLLTRFNPTDFDPDSILDLAEAAGMEYVCLTAKHHDGFCLWDTKSTDFNVMKSPYGKDIVGQLADACHRRHFHLGLYYSVVDWHHPNYPNQGRHHELPPQPGDNPDWNAYMDYLTAQATELCKNYGEIKHWFWDINVPEHRDDSVNQLLRSLQPNIVINDRGFDEGDFGTPEREYEASENKHVTCFGRPTEACNSVGTQSWGYREDEDYYTSQFLIQSIDAMMAKGANYLLNVGPDGDGRITKDASRILMEIGKWYGKVREAFSDTQPCTGLTTNPNVLLTRRGYTLYVHLASPPIADAVLLPPISVLPLRASLLNTGKELECSTDVLPTHWQNENHILRVKGLTHEVLRGNETIVLKLEFGCDIPWPTSDVKEFQG